MTLESERWRISKDVQTFSSSDFLISSANIFASTCSSGRARLGPIRLRPACLFELGPFDFGQFDLGQKKSHRHLFNSGQKFLTPPLPPHLPTLPSSTVGKHSSCKGGAPNGGRTQNFVLFFPLPPQFSFFLLSLGRLLVVFWWCLKRWGRQMCMFGVLGLSCEAPAAPKPIRVKVNSISASSG